MKEDVEGMWLNDGQRFWEKEPTFSCNGTRQSYFGELNVVAVVAADNSRYISTRQVLAS